MRWSTKKRGRQSSMENSHFERHLTSFFFPCHLTRLLQGWWTGSGSAHRWTLPLWNGNWWQRKSLPRRSALRNFSNLFPITARCVRDESTRHDSRFVARIRSDHARCAGYIQGPDYILTLKRSCNLQFIEERSRSCVEENCKFQFLGAMYVSDVSWIRLNVGFNRRVEEKRW